MGNNSFQLGEKFLDEYKVKSQYIKGLSNYGFCDQSIAPLIRDLNQAGYHTKFSCSGLKQDHPHAEIIGFPYIYFYGNIINPIVRNLSKYFIIMIEGHELTIYHKDWVIDKGEGFIKTAWDILHNSI